MLFDVIPIWVLFLATVLVVMIGIEAGYRLGRWSYHRSTEEKESPVSAISGTVLGLVAFMLALTFSMVANRFDDRKRLVREEANAIRTAWLRCDFLPSPSERTEARQLLREYLDARIEWVQSGNIDPAHLQEMLSRVQRIHERLWTIAAANAGRDLNSEVGALYVESLNEVFAIHALRVAIGIQTRMPNGIWLVLLAITILGMMSVGYQTGIAGSRRSMARPILALSFAMVIMLIAVLDRPATGIVTQQPLIDLRESMEAGQGS